MRKADRLFDCDVMGAEVAAAAGRSADRMWWQNRPLIGTEKSDGVARRHLAIPLARGVATTSRSMGWMAPYKNLHLLEVAEQTRMECFLRAWTTRTKTVDWVRSGPRRHGSANGDVPCATQEYAASDLREAQGTRCQVDGARLADLFLFTERVRAGSRLG
jgi:hypothetical protein